VALPFVVSTATAPWREGDNMLGKISGGGAARTRHPVLIIGALAVLMGGIGTVGAAASSDGSTASGFHPLAPVRVIDTRTGVGGHTGPIGDLTLTAADLDVVPDDATALVLNVTVDQPSAKGFLSVQPVGTPAHQVSNLNFVAG
jgi:hypothetical protein